MHIDTAAHMYARNIWLEMTPGEKARNWAGTGGGGQGVGEKLFTVFGKNIYYYVHVLFY